MPENNKSHRTVKVSDKVEDIVAVMVYATFPAAESAIEAGRRLVEARLAGCINVLPHMTSVYVWKGKTETAAEAVLIAKTTKARVEECMTAILATHPYETPAILALPVVGGSHDYLSWIVSGTR